MSRRTADKQARAERLAALRARQEQARAAVAARRGDKKPRKRPSRLWWLVLIALLLLLCCRPCRCTPEPEGTGPAQPEGTVQIEPSTPQAAPEPAPVLPRIPRQKRPALDITPPPSPSWLDAFRLQVAARSPRLAACFEGQDGPGQLKWTTSIVPRGGAVSEHSLEPMLSTASLTAPQRDCMLQALSTPNYNLPETDAPSTPQRVGLVIEF